MIVLGVEDETWNLVGIDPQQFDSERIGKMGREVVRPMIRVTAILVPRQDLHFCVILNIRKHISEMLCLNAKRQSIVILEFELRCVVLPEEYSRQH